MSYRDFVKRLNLPLTVVVVLAQTIGAYFFGSGLDFALFRQATSSYSSDVWLPAYAYWLLRPIMWLPFHLSLAVLVLISTSLMAYTGYRFYSLDVLFAVGVPYRLTLLTHLPFLPWWPSAWIAWRFQVLAIVPILGLIGPTGLLSQERS
jgi:hypothetical protein